MCISLLLHWTVAQSSAGFNHLMQRHPVDCPLQALFFQCRLLLLLLLLLYYCFYYYLRLCPISVHLPPQSLSFSLKYIIFLCKDFALALASLAVLMLRSCQLVTGKFTCNFPASYRKKNPWNAGRTGNYTLLTRSCYSAFQSTGTL